MDLLLTTLFLHNFILYNMLICLISELFSFLFHLCCGELFWLMATSTTSSKPSNNNKSTKDFLCIFYKRGHCRYGDQCNFLHTDDDSVTDSEVVCRFFLRGNCRYGNDCYFVHCDQYKPPPRSLNKFSSDVTARPSSSKSIQHASGALNQYHSDLIKSAEAELCPVFISRPCHAGCDKMHGTVCQYCGLAVLHPYCSEQRKAHIVECEKSLEKNMEFSFCVQRSRDKKCGICFEIILEKLEQRQQRFAILEKCNHCFCTRCIKEWRSQRDHYESNTRLGCPECRVRSDFVVPSDHWVDDPEEKTALIKKFKEGCALKHCKNFKRGDGYCFLDKKCFFKHEDKDGNVVTEQKRRQCRRRNSNAIMLDGEVQALMEDIQFHAQLFSSEFFTDDDYAFSDDDDNFLHYPLSDEDDFFSF